MPSAEIWLERSDDINGSLAEGDVDYGYTLQWSSLYFGAGMALTTVAGGTVAPDVPVKIWPVE